MHPQVKHTHGRVPGACIQLPLLPLCQTHGFLPRKQSPAHSVAFCSISELGETKAACWLHSKPTGTGCFPPEEGGVHTLNQKQTRGSHPWHLTRLPEERHLAKQVASKQPRIKLELKGYPVLSRTFEALEKEYGLQIKDKSSPRHEVPAPGMCTHSHRNHVGVPLPN